MPKQYQNIAFVVVALIIAFVAYTYLFTGKVTPILTEQTISPVASADQDLISLLLQLKAITLDESIFSDQTFTGLEDFSRELIPEAVGRENPFAPLGSSQAKVPSSP